ncbi:ATPase, T2SS/T4P/T4SS family [Halobellus sp. GM3]|uniref:ATPase, T2SS/T4P/T4SS family n=1 Tax=Halobellus sp. GM3 TaxID=3458410 RepID=UPI00403D9973
MATDDDASDADPGRDGDDALGGDGEGSPSTLEGGAVDRVAGEGDAARIDAAEESSGDDESAGDGGAPDDGSTAAAVQPAADDEPEPNSETAVEDDPEAAEGDSEATEDDPEAVEDDSVAAEGQPADDGLVPNDEAVTGDDAVSNDDAAPDAGPRVALGEYTWAEFLEEYGVDGDVRALYRGSDPREIERERDADEGGTRWDDGTAVEPPTPTRADWDEVSLDPESFLAFHPTDAAETVESAIERALRLDEEFEAFCDPETTPVVKDVWLWEHYKREYYYEPDGSRPRDDDGEIERFDPADALGFDPDAIENALARGADRAAELDAVVDDRTVDVDPAFDEDAFFADARGATTVVNRYDLEKAVPMEKKLHFREVERYWVNKPHSFVIIFHSRKENEKKYYVVEPYQNRIEADLAEFLTGKLRTAIKYDDESVIGEGPNARRRVIEQQALELLERYGLYRAPERPRRAGLSILPPTRGEGSDDGVLSGIDLDLGLGLGSDDAESAESGGTGGANGSVGAGGPIARYARAVGLGEGSFGGRLDWLFEGASAARSDPSLEGIAARPEPAVLAEDATSLTDYQVEKLLYVLRRDFIGYERIDAIKHDVNVEDISCDGYNSPAFVYHSDYEQIISNVYHGEEELDDFVVKLAQRSGKGISKRRPQVDATLPDGSRAQLTLGREVSDHGTNYTIRQFKDVPFTPIDLINWKTFSLEEMAFLWLCIENDKSLIFAGGTASGKTTSLNAVSLFIPSNAKIVSIEDTREVELPQRNWVASVTRPSFSDDDRGDVDEFDLLEAALRQRPDYIVMGEIRGEEGRTLFQVMSTGHTTYTTFHADSVGEVLKRFTTDPINVSKTMFTALDLVSVQTSTRVQGNKVRRNKSLTEINHYDAENDEINVQDVYQWQAEGDEFLKMGASNTLEDVRFDRGWTRATLDEELFKRRVVLAYLIDRGLNTYSQVAATLQAFINDPETILALMARDDLERSLEDLREMESVKIDVDPEKEEMVPRPDPGEEIRDLCADILAEAEEDLWPEYRDLEDVDVAEALLDVEAAPDVAAESGDHPELDALAERADVPELESGSASETDGDDDVSTPPALEGDVDDAADAEGAGGAEGVEDAEDAGDAEGAGDEGGAGEAAVTVPEETDAAADSADDGRAGDPADASDGDVDTVADEETIADADGDADEETDVSADSDGAASANDGFGIEDLLDGAAEADDSDGDDEEMWDFGEFEQVDPDGSAADGDAADSEEDG